MTVFVADEQSHGEVDADRLARLATFVLAHQGISDAMELTVLCVEINVMAELNSVHMGADRPTDVLAFPLDDPSTLGPSDGEDEDEDALPRTGLLGDVVLCPEVAMAQAEALGRTPQQEMDLLVVHGILHVLGHDHAEEDEKAIMFGLTDRLLADFSTAPEGAQK